MVLDENIVHGFLFGKCGKKNLIKGEYSRLKGNFKLLRKLFSIKGVSFKKKLLYLNMFSEHDRNRQKIEPNRENEVNSFAVNPNSQGKGLMNAFIDFYKVKKVKRITLDTDKECNYKFYENFGFKIKGEFYSPLQKEYSGKSGESFIYEINIMD